MTVVPTDWKARADELGALLITVEGERQPWRVLRDFDADIFIDLSNQLHVDETLTDPTLRLFRLAGVGEVDDVDVSTDTIPGPNTITPTGITIRVKNLASGRYYRLNILHGAPGNRRGSALLIQSVG